MNVAPLLKGLPPIPDDFADELSQLADAMMRYFDEHPDEAVEITETMRAMASVLCERVGAGDRTDDPSAVMLVVSLALTRVMLASSGAATR